MGFPRGFASSISRFLTALFPGQLTRTSNEAVTTANCQDKTVKEPTRIELLGQNHGLLRTSIRAALSCIIYAVVALQDPPEPREHHTTHPREANVAALQTTQGRGREGPGARCGRSGGSVKPVTELESGQGSWGTVLSST